MRVTNSVPSRQKRKKLLKRAKGFSKSRQIYRKAKETLLKSGQRAYRGRKERKRMFRRLWIIRLSAAAKNHNMKYSQLIDRLKKNEVGLNRKVLSEIAISDPKTFEKIIKEIAE